MIEVLFTPLVTGHTIVALSDCAATVTEGSCVPDAILVLVAIALLRFVAFLSHAKLIFIPTPSQNELSEIHSHRGSVGENDVAHSLDINGLGHHRRVWILHGYEAIGVYPGGGIVR